MKRYWVYLKYVLCHKWFVMMACFDQGMFWRGLSHDLSKFLPGEFIPYARYFYEKDGTKKTIRDKTGYYKPTDTGNYAFDVAWLKHQKRNKHHWQWWICPLDDGGFKAINMHPQYIHEMVCDWIGAGRAQGVENWEDPWPWYKLNKDKIILSTESRFLLENIYMPARSDNAEGE